MLDDGPARTNGARRGALRSTAGSASGVRAPAFDTIVAAGPNAALPHARPGERKLTEGDLVVLDFGGVYDSYCVDLTRTVSVGPADGSRAGGLRRGPRGARSRHRGGRAGPIALRDRRRGAGHADAAADWARRSATARATAWGSRSTRIPASRGGGRTIDDDVTDEVLAAGMVFTIEPGAYLPGWGGVRIEDDVLVTEDGVEVLTDVTTELWRSEDLMDLDIDQSETDSRPRARARALRIRNRARRAAAQDPQGRDGRARRRAARAPVPAAAAMPRGRCSGARVHAGGRGRRAGARRTAAEPDDAKSSSPSSSRRSSARSIARPSPAPPRSSRSARR